MQLSDVSLSALRLADLWELHAGSMRSGNNRLVGLMGWNARLAHRQGDGVGKPAMNALASVTVVLMDEPKQGSNVWQLMTGVCSGDWGRTYSKPISTCCRG